MISVEAVDCLYFRVFGDVAMVDRTSEGDDIVQSLGGGRRFQLYDCGTVIDFATFSVELMRSDGVIFCEEGDVWCLKEYEG